MIQPSDRIQPSYLDTPHARNRDLWFSPAPAPQPRAPMESEESFPELVDGAGLPAPRATRREVTTLLERLVSELRAQVSEINTRQN